jgi:hypothetical protein
MTTEQVERLRVLCDEFDKGALRFGETKELVKLARLAARELAIISHAVGLK